MRTPDEASTSKTVVLVAITMPSFLAPMALSSVNVALPTMAKELAMDTLSLSWVATAYMVAAAMVLVPLGRLADIVGRKKIFLTGTGVFTLSNVAALISYSATYAAGFLLSLYLQQIKGLSPLSAGTILVSQPIVQALFSPLAGRVSDRIEPRLVASTGMAVTAVGLFFLHLLRQRPRCGSL